MLKRGLGLVLVNPTLNACEGQVEYSIDEEKRTEKAKGNR
jgi:hypothetical protein